MIIIGSIEFSLSLQLLIMKYADSFLCCLTKRSIDACRPLISTLTIHSTLTIQKHPPPPRGVVGFCRCKIISMQTSVEYIIYINISDIQSPNSRWESSIVYTIEKQVASRPDLFSFLGLSFRERRRRNNAAHLRSTWTGMCRGTLKICGLKKVDAN